MISDVQLGIFCNILGVTLFVLVILYHYIQVNGTRALKGSPFQLSICRESLQVFQ